MYKFQKKIDNVEQVEEECSKLEPPFHFALRGHQLFERHGEQRTMQFHLIPKVEYTGDPDIPALEATPLFYTQLEGSGWSKLNDDIIWILEIWAPISNIPGFTPLGACSDVRKRKLPVTEDKVPPLKRRAKPEAPTLRRLVFEALHPPIYDSSRNIISRDDDWRKFADISLHEACLLRGKKIVVLDSEGAKLFQFGESSKTHRVLQQRDGKFHLLKVQDKNKHEHTYCEVCSNLHRAPECERIEPCYERKKDNQNRGSFKRFEPLKPIITIDYETLPDESGVEVAQMCGVALKYGNFEMMAVRKNLDEALEWAMIHIGLQFEKIKLDRVPCENANCSAKQSRKICGVQMCDRCRETYPFEFAVFAHNNKGFDSKFELLDISNSTSLVIENIRTKKTTKIDVLMVHHKWHPLWVFKICDSMNHMPGSLDSISKAYQVGGKYKIPLSILRNEENCWYSTCNKPIESIFEECSINRWKVEHNFDSIKTNEDLVQIYCAIDCLILARCICIYRLNIEEQTRIETDVVEEEFAEAMLSPHKICGLDILEYFGSPALADAQVKRRLWVEQRENLAIPPADLYFKFHEQIRGGVSTPFYRYAHSSKGPIVALDVNALYSWCMMQKLPNKFLRELDGQYEADENEICIYICDVAERPDKTYIAPHPMKLNTTKLGWSKTPLKNYWTIKENLTSFHTVKKTLVFQGLYTHKSFIEVNIEARKKATAAGNKALAEICKLLNNSAYGKTCENILKYNQIGVADMNTILQKDKREIVMSIPVKAVQSDQYERQVVWPQKDYGKYKVHDSVHDSYKRRMKPQYYKNSTSIASYSITQKEGQMCIFKSDMKRFELTRSPQIGFAVLEYAKFKIQQLLNILQDKHFRLLYTDTDSIYFQVPTTYAIDWKTAVLKLRREIPHLLDVPIDENDNILAPAKTPGLFSLDVVGPTEEMVAIAPKSYAILDEQEKIKHKGIPQKSASWLCFDYFKNKYFNKEDSSKEPLENVFIRKGLNIFIKNQEKLGPGYKFEHQKFIYIGEPGYEEEFSFHLQPPIDIQQEFPISINTIERFCTS
ncbi:non-structural protein [Bark beetle-associated densovirus]|nr:non-structural protein [Bark beetle-associated densovirus]